MILFFDTETTGKADLRMPPDEDCQPRLVQLAALLTDDSGDEVASANLIVRPDGFTIPNGASDIHGITTEIARECGFNLTPILNLFHGMVNKAGTLVAHNIDFDSFIIRGEFFRAKKADPFQLVREMFCTMKSSTDICKIPGPYGNKWPKLQEAYKHAFGVEFDGAHDALADVRACARVYFWIKSLENKCTTSITKKPTTETMLLAKSTTEPALSLVK